MPRAAPPKPALRQEPHGSIEPVTNVLEAAIGAELRELRRARGMTVAELAEATGLSIGMLSKIENGQTSPSLTSLKALARGLGVPISGFFRRFEDRSEASFVPAGQGLDVERRGSRAGHQYRLLGHTAAPASPVVVEPYMITLTEESDRFPTFQHAGLEWLHMLEGEVTYRHGDRLYRMRPGDSLFFEAKVPHGPVEMHAFPIRYLSVIAYAKES